MMTSDKCSVDAVLFDYGGVLAEEGFHAGLAAIARENGLDPGAFFEHALEEVHASGYVTGRASEEEYWARLRRGTGIAGSDSELRERILSRFVLRPWMVDLVEALRKAGLITAILSDQTDWLMELDHRDRFFRFFDHVFNSFVEGRSKRDPALFDAVVERLGVPAGKVLFVDDNDGNIERARRRGLAVIHYRGREDFLTRLRVFCPGLEIFGRRSSGPR